MANSNGRKGVHDIAPEIRGAFIRAAKRLDDEGTPLSELVYQSLKDNFLQTLTAISKFTIREARLEGSVKHDHKHTHESVSETAEWVEGMLGITEKGKAKKPRKARSVLPDPLPPESTRH